MGEITKTEDEKGQGVLVGRKHSLIRPLIKNGINSIRFYRALKMEKAFWGKRFPVYQNGKDQWSN